MADPVHVVLALGAFAAFALAALGCERRSGRGVVVIDEAIRRRRRAPARRPRRRAVPAREVLRIAMLSSFASPRFTEVYRT
jgi:hypothetical protein